MSAGAVFKLIANDGKADRMIMATELLNQRIKDIMCARAARGFADPTPTLVDIERTHILFVNSHFKPFAAIGYEYNQIKTNSGNPIYNSTVQFSIQQFGDFFNDMVINITLAQTSASAGSVPALPAWIGAYDQGYLDVNNNFTTVAPATIYGQQSGLPNTAAGIYTQYTQRYVTLAGQYLPVGATSFSPDGVTVIPVQNYVRYCEYPGERICKHVYFNVNGNPIDDYTAEAMIFFQKFKVAPHKEIGWKRLVGQEITHESYSDVQSIQGQTAYAQPISNLLDINSAAVNGSPVNSALTTRKVFHVVHGAQTPKATQPALDLWVPLLFWFCRDPRQAIASVAIPYGQRFITVDIEAQANILFTAPGNLFYKLTVEQWTSNDATTKGTKNAIAVYDYKIWSTVTPVLIPTSNIDPTQTITQMNLYTNNIFVNPEIHDIFIKRIGFSLIRVYRFQSNREMVSTDSVLLSQLKWPVETLFVALRPAINIDPSNPNQYRDWHKFYLVTDVICDISTNANGRVAIDDTVSFSSNAGKIKSVTSRESAERFVVQNMTETVSTLELKAHGIDIFQQYPSKFFRDYLSYTYGGINIVTPYDLGAYMFNFCLYPGTYQPSGHINVSRARELYVIFTSNYTGSSTPADLLNLAVAINFLLISDGSAVLRYST